MENTAYIALSRQGVLRRKMSTIAHNLANMNTTGFKSERMMFVDHLTRSRSSDFIADQRLSFVRDVASFRDTSAGPIEQTSNTLDVAIHGEGFFTVRKPDGTTGFTRNGSFRMDNGGQLVNQSGLPVLTDAGTPIFFTPADTTITISGDGTVSTENGKIGKLDVVTFDNAYQLKREAGGMYSTDQQPIKKVDPQVVQGALEGSNVQSILEMTKMIEVNRSYSSAQKLIDREDQRIRQMVREMVAPN